MAAAAINNNSTDFILLDTFFLFTDILQKSPPYLLNKETQDIEKSFINILNTYTSILTSGNKSVSGKYGLTIIIQVSLISPYIEYHILIKK